MPPFQALAVIETLAGRSSGVQDPWLASVEGMAGQDLQPHQAAVIDRVAAMM
jgi:hypothetical protein